MTEMEMGEWETTGYGGPTNVPGATQVPIEEGISTTPTGEVQYGYGPMDVG